MLFAGCTSTVENDPACQTSPTCVAEIEKEEVACRSLRACLAEIEKIASDDAQLTAVELAVSQRIQRHGPRAIDPLIRLLDDERASVRAVASHTLWRIKGLAPRHARPILKAALREGRSGALAWVLARIDSEEAVDGLIRILRQDPQVWTPIGAVLSESLSYDVNPDRLDLVAYPGIEVRVLSALTGLLASSEENEVLQRAVIEILASTFEPKDRFTAPLAHLAADPTRSVALRQAAIVGLLIIGSSETGAIPELRMIAGDAASPLAVDASVALFVIEGPKPGTSYERVFAPLVRRTMRPLPSNTFTTDDFTEVTLTSSIAKLWLRGNEARHAAGALIDLLAQATSTEVRAQAAWNLGFFADPPAGPALIRSLGADDWLLVAAAADSLGRLGMREALTALSRVADEHWYPPVRTVARRARAALDGDFRYPEFNSDDYHSFVAILDENVLTATSLPASIPAPCVDPRRDETAPRNEAYFSDESNPDLAASLEFESTGAQMLKPGDERRRIIPAWGVGAEDGWFVAENRGEFGGELVFIPDDGRPYVVARGNFENVHQLVDGRWVAISGLAHMGGDHGELIELRRETRAWAAYPWRRLPGAPASTWEWPDASWQRPDGTLVVNTNRGSVVVHPDGRLEMAKCTPGLPERARGANG